MVSRTLVSAVLLVGLLGACAGEGEEVGRAEVTVERIVDGDTLVLADGRRVRLVQIDAPEETESECYAAEATDELEALVPAGTVVALEPDPGLDQTDDFGRLLRYVLRGDMNANLELVGRGAAAPWFYEGDRGRYADELLEVAETAREERRGLWSACPAARLDPERALDAG
jgi:micrococcal nuclease